MDGDTLFDAFNGYVSDPQWPETDTLDTILDNGSYYKDAYWSDNALPGVDTSFSGTEPTSPGDAIVFDSPGAIFDHYDGPRDDPPTPLPTMRSILYCDEVLSPSVSTDVSLDDGASDDELDVERESASEENKDDTESATSLNSSLEVALPDEVTFDLASDARVYELGKRGAILNALRYITAASQHINHETRTTSLSLVHVRRIAALFLGALDVGSVQSLLAIVRASRGTLAESVLLDALTTPIVPLLEFAARAAFFGAETVLDALVLRASATQAALSPDELGAARSLVWLLMDWRATAPAPALLELTVALMARGLERSAASSAYLRMSERVASTSRAFAGAPRTLGGEAAATLFARRALVAACEHLDATLVNMVVQFAHSVAANVAALFAETAFVDGLCVSLLGRIPCEAHARVLEALLAHLTHLPCRERFWEYLSALNAGGLYAKVHERAAQLAAQKTAAVVRTEEERPKPSKKKRVHTEPGKPDVVYYGRVAVTSTPVCGRKPRAEAALPKKRARKSGTREEGFIYEPLASSTAVPKRAYKKQRRE